MRTVRSGSGGGFSEQPEIIAAVGAMRRRTMASGFIMEVLGRSARFIGWGTARRWPALGFVIGSNTCQPPPSAL